MKKILLLLFLGACTPAPYAPPGTNDCDAAEAKLLELQCKDSRGELLGGRNKHNVSFGDRCRTIQENSVSLNPTCLKNITACTEIDPCLQSQ